MEGLTTQLTKLDTKTGPSGELEQRMLTYSEKAAVDALKGTRQILEQGYVAKSQYTEDVAGITRKFEDLKQNNDQVIASKIAEYKQTVDGQFTTITNQMSDMLRKTDIQITPGQISFGVGKEISGRTISSLMVQEPESIALIAKLIKVKGDMVVDGSILGRHIASESVETGHMKAGSVTTPILASNSVTADKVLVDSAMIDKLVSNQAFIRELTSQKAFITQLNSIDIASNRFTGERIVSTDGSLVFDLVSNHLTMKSNTASISREDAGYPTQFIRYESSIEQNRKHSKTIIGSNRNGSKNWNSVSFSGIVVDNNSDNGVDKIFQYGDYNNMRHASSDDGWNFSVVSQMLTPGIWNKNSEIWCRHYVIPKATKSDTDLPTEFIRLDESVAALWKLFEHLSGQAQMTGAMRKKIIQMLGDFGYRRDHIL